MSVTLTTTLLRVRNVIHDTLITRTLDTYRQCQFWGNNFNNSDHLFEHRTICNEGSFRSEAPVSSSINPLRDLYVSETEKVIAKFCVEAP